MTLTITHEYRCDCCTYVQKSAEKLLHNWCEITGFDVEINKDGQLVATTTLPKSSSELQFHICVQCKPRVLNVLNMALNEKRKTS